ncbi:MAG: hypothetical protein EOP11_02990 [Proteobacteria bacterium]|nr:MAG: hypothetical protein EOP11_02990 [Pseudomonadota bacterium]
MLIQLLAAAILATASPASPSSSALGTVILRCNLSAGPNQEVSVREEANGALTLLELSGSGRLHNRPLSRAEWNSRRLSLRSDLSTEENVLTAERGAWTFYSQGGGVNIVSLADCW